MLGKIIFVNQMKNKLGDRYKYERFLSDREIRKIKRKNPSRFNLKTVSSLTAGCLKIEICIFKLDGRIQLGYDIFVKDDPDSFEWICYDSPDDQVIVSEAEMLSVLDRIVKEKGLSYTECCFERINGILVKKDTDFE